MIAARRNHEFIEMYD